MASAPSTDPEGNALNDAADKLAKAGLTTDEAAALDVVVRAIKKRQLLKRIQDRANAATEVRNLHDMTCQGSLTSALGASQADVPTLLAMIHEQQEQLDKVSKVADVLSSSARRTTEETVRELAAGAAEEIREALRPG